MDEKKCMNKALWIARKNHLRSMIDKISIGYGRDEKEWLERHFMEVLELYPDERLEEAITCYQEILNKMKYYTKYKVGHEKKI